MTTCWFQAAEEALSVRVYLVGYKGLSSTCGTRRFLLQSQHSRHYDAATAGDVSSSDFTFNLFSSLTVCGAPAVTAGGC
jgi:hypothetical protein